MKAHLKMAAALNGPSVATLRTLATTVNALLDQAF